MLVDYGSPSPEPVMEVAQSPPQQPALPPPVFDEEDDEDEDFNPANAFAIQSASTTTTTIAAAPRQPLTVSAAPDVLIPIDASTSLITRPSDSIIFYNPTYEDMSRPVEGPVNPWNDRKLVKMNTHSGTFELGNVFF